MLQEPISSIAEIRENYRSQLRQRFEALEQQSRALASQLKQPLKDPAQGTTLKASLKQIVQESFNARQELRRAELAEFTVRLHNLQQSIELRDRIAEKIIDRRVQELLEPNLAWESPNGAAPETAYGVPIGNKSPAPIPATKSAESAGVRVQLQLDSDVYTREMLFRNKGFNGISILAEGVTGIINGIRSENITGIMAHRYRLESFDETQDFHGKIYWQATIFVPQDPTIDGANHSISQQTIDRMLQKGVKFRLDHFRGQDDQTIDSDAASPASSDSVSTVYDASDNHPSDSQTDDHEPKTPNSGISEKLSGIAWGPAVKGLQAGVRVERHSGETLQTGELRTVVEVSASDLPDRNEAKTGDTKNATEKVP